MPTANLNKQKIEVNDGLDCIVVIQALSQLPGGCTLDVTGLSDDTTVIKSGHVLVMDKKTKEISPLKIEGENYGSLDEGKEYFGVLKCSVLKNDPRAAVITAGQINEAASPAPVTDEIKKALPRIQWLYGTSNE